MNHHDGFNPDDSELIEDDARGGALVAGLGILFGLACLAAFGYAILQAIQ